MITIERTSTLELSDLLKRYEISREYEIEPYRVPGMFRSAIYAAFGASNVYLYPDDSGPSVAKWNYVSHKDKVLKLILSMKVIRIRP